MSSFSIPLPMVSAPAGGASARILDAVVNLRALDANLKLYGGHPQLLKDFTNAAASGSLRPLVLKAEGFRVENGTENVAIANYSAAKSPRGDSTDGTRAPFFFRFSNLFPSACLSHKRQRRR